MDEVKLTANHFQGRLNLYSMLTYIYENENILRMQMKISHIFDSDVYYVYIILP